MRTYLGLTRRAAIAVAVGASAIGAAIGIALPASCDDGARCISDEAYADVLATLEAMRAERTGGRFATDLLAECAATNGAPLTPDACASYLAERAAIAAACGSIVAQDAYEACEAPARAAYRADSK